MQVLVSPQTDPFVFIRQACWPGEGGRRQPSLRRSSRIPSVVFNLPREIDLLRGTSSTYLATRQEIAWLNEIFAFRRQPQVAKFLRDHPFLAPLLSEAYLEIEKHFGPSPSVFLEVVTDPEATDDHMLYALIGTRLPPEDALERLDRLDEDWWLGSLDRARNSLCIHVEYL